MQFPTMVWSFSQRLANPDALVAVGFVAAMLACGSPEGILLGVLLATPQRDEETVAATLLIGCAVAAGIHFSVPCLPE